MFWFWKKEIYKYINGILYKEWKKYIYHSKWNDWKEIIHKWDHIIQLNNFENWFILWIWNEAVLYKWMSLLFNKFWKLSLELSEYILQDSIWRLTYSLTFVSELKWEKDKVYWKSFNFEESKIIPVLSENPIQFVEWRAVISNNNKQYYIDLDWQKIDKVYHEIIDTKYEYQIWKWEEWYSLIQNWKQVYFWYPKLEIGKYNSKTQIYSDYLFDWIYPFWNNIVKLQKWHKFNLGFKEWWNYIFPEFYLHIEKLWDYYKATHEKWNTYFTKDFKTVTYDIPWVRKCYYDKESNEFSISHWLEFDNDDIIKTPINHEWYIDDSYAYWKHDEIHWNRIFQDRYLEDTPYMRGENRNWYYYLNKRRDIIYSLYFKYISPLNKQWIWFIRNYNWKYSFYTKKDLRNNKLMSYSQGKEFDDIRYTRQRHFLIKNKWVYTLMWSQNDIIYKWFHEFLFETKNFVWLRKWLHFIIFNKTTKEERYFESIEYHHPFIIVKEKDKNWTKVWDKLKTYRILKLTHTKILEVFPIQMDKIKTLWRWMLNEELRYQFVWFNENMWYLYVYDKEEKVFKKIKESKNELNIFKYNYSYVCERDNSWAKKYWFLDSKFLPISKKYDNVCGLSKDWQYASVKINWESFIIHINSDKRLW